MEISLDEKDGKILRALQEDGRAQLKAIAKRTGIPPDSVKYRMDRMEKHGVIKNYVVICDTLKLGYPILAWVNLRLQNVDESKEKQFIAFLKSTDQIVYIAKTTGAYHYLIGFCAHSVPDMDRQLQAMLSKHPEMIKEYSTSLLVEEIQYDRYDRLIKARDSSS